MSNTGNVICWLRNELLSAQAQETNLVVRQGKCHIPSIVLRSARTETLELPFNQFRLNHSLIPDNRFKLIAHLLIGHRIYVGREPRYPFAIGDNQVVVISARLVADAVPD